MIIFGTRGITYRSTRGGDLTTEQVRAEAHEAESDGTTVGEFIACIVNNLNDNGKELVLKAAYFVAVADSEFAESEKKVVYDVGRALGLSPSEIVGVLGDLEDLE